MNSPTSVSLRKLESSSHKKTGAHVEIPFTNYLLPGEKALPLDYILTKRRLVASPVALFFTRTK